MESSPPCRAVVRSAQHWLVRVNRQGRTSRPNPLVTAAAWVLALEPSPQFNRRGPASARPRNGRRPRILCCLEPARSSRSTSHTACVRENGSAGRRGPVRRGIVIMQKSSGLNTTAARRRCTGESHQALCGLHHGRHSALTLQPAATAAQAELEAAVFLRACKLGRASWMSGRPSKRMRRRLKPWPGEGARDDPAVGVQVRGRWRRSHEAGPLEGGLLVVKREYLDRAQSRYGSESRSAAVERESVVERRGAVLWRTPDQGHRPGGCERRRTAAADVSASTVAIGRGVGMRAIWV